MLFFVDEVGFNICMKDDKKGSQKFLAKTGTMPRQQAPTSSIKWAALPLLNALGDLIMMGIIFTAQLLHHLKNSGLMYLQRLLRAYKNKT